MGAPGRDLHLHGQPRPAGTVVRSPLGRGEPGRAASQVQVDKRTAADWDKGITQFTGGRRYSDGRVVRYDKAAILANVKSPRTTYTRGAPVDLARLETVVDTRYLSLVEREQIHDLRSLGQSMRAVGRSDVGPPPVDDQS